MQRSVVRAGLVLTVLGAVALLAATAGDVQNAPGSAVLDEREHGARGRRVLNRVHSSELSHGTDQSLHAWHQGACCACRLFHS